MYSMQVKVISRNGIEFKSEEAYWFDCKFELRRLEDRRQKTVCSANRGEAINGVGIE